MSERGETGGRFLLQKNRTTATKQVGKGHAQRQKVRRKESDVALNTEAKRNLENLVL